MSSSASVYASFSSKKTPQTEPIPGTTDQVVNSAGGYVYTLDPMKAVERFLILGSEGGTYYAKEQKLTKENALRTIEAIKTNGKAVVDLTVAISDSGRAVKNDPAIFVLALASSFGDDFTRKYALSMLPKVCRIPTHLFHFAQYVQGFRGWGRGLKRAVGEWYQSLPVEKLAYECVKYQQRDGWSNSDLLRLSHPKTPDFIRNNVYRWIVDGFVPAIKQGQLGGEAAGLRVGEHVLPQIIPAFEQAKITTDPKELVELITTYNLSREMLPTEALTHPMVWEAMLPKMPLTAMIRNLGNMSKIGLLTPLSEAAKLVKAKLGDQTALKKARIHPLSVLVALRTYESGQGLKGSGTWSPVPSVVDALDDAFYTTFDYLEPTGKTLLFGLDVSGSMTWGNVAGMPIDPRTAGACLAMATARSESNYHIMGFSHEFVDIGITAKMSLAQVIKKIDNVQMGRTDCSLPMVWALKNKVKVDGFIVITDNESYCGIIHPSQALAQYRKSMGIHAKNIVIAMTSTGFTINDPKDPYGLDIVGFSADGPSVISSFMRS